MDPTIDPEEMVRFQRIADSWWDPSGSFWPLHLINQFRQAYLADWFATMHNKKPSSVFSSWQVLDIGCGGGLMSEAMHSLGAEVTGVDALPRNIAIAKQHAKKNELTIQYLDQSIESVASELQPQDLVLNLEVVEHVSDLPLFMKSASRLVKPNGYMVVSTINKTLVARTCAIFMAENVLKLLPKGTHQYEKLRTPDEIQGLLQPEGFQLVNQIGVSFNPFSKQVKQSAYMGMNYMQIYQKTL